MRIFINSLPKSGTNLVAKLIGNLGYQYSNKSIALSSLLGRYEVVKRLTRSACLRGGSVEVGLEINAAVSSAWLKRYLAKIPDEQYVTGHSAFSEHLWDMLLSLDYRVIQVIRNPYDVMLSYAKYFVEDVNSYYPTHGTLRDLTIDQRIRLIAEGGKLIDSPHYMRGIREVLRSQEGWFEEKGVLPVRFEDLVGPKGGGSKDKQRETIKRICSHLGIDEGRGEKVMDSLYGGTHTFRSGKIGSYTQSLEKKTLHLIREKLENVRFVAELGYLDEV